jgi:hypothetical protein
MKERVLLFDMDGVLLEPSGYRKAVEATVNRLGQMMGLGPVYPGEDVIALFEAYGVIVEWDMVPLILAQALEAWQADYPEDPMPEAFAELKVWSAAHPAREMRIDYRKLLSVVSQAGGDGFYADKALVLSETLFMTLGNTPLLKTLLKGTRSLENICTRTFQTYVLGSQFFSENYLLKAEFKTPAFLTLFDRPLIDQNHRLVLLERIQEGGCRAAVFTARPSAFAGTKPPIPISFSPEAELGLACAGLNGLAFASTGLMNFLASRVSLPASQLVKPFAGHALAGFCRAVLGAGPGDEAFVRLLSGEPVEALQDRTFSLFIFEDSQAGIKSARAACQILNSLGIQTELTINGISQNPDKIKALSAQGATLYPDINQALSVVLKK